MRIWRSWRKRQSEGRKNRRTEEPKNRRTRREPILVLGFFGSWNLFPMRPYLAIIKDSFREALASRVLWILLSIITLKLVLLAPLTVRVNLTTDFTWGDIAEGPRLVGAIR